MDDLSRILGGIGGGDGVSGLLSRFQQGQHDDVPDATVHEAYGQVASQVPQDQYVAAAQQAFERLTPDQRAQFAQQLQQQAQQRGVSVPVGADTTDPRQLANAVGEVHAQQPNVLQQMFAPGGTFSNPIAKTALLGIAAFAAQRLMGGRR